MTVTSTNMAASSDSSESTVRRRRVDGRKTETDSADSCRENGADSSRDTDTEKRRESVQTGTFWLTRIVLLRSVAFIYCESAELFKILRATVTTRREVLLLCTSCSSVLGILWSIFL